MNNSTPHDSIPRDDEHAGKANSETQYFAAGDVVRILDDYLEQLKAGRAPSRETLLAQHPELATQLDACLAGLNFLHTAQASTPQHQQIGDFRIVREVGRGGMGAVFEAVQISLGRRVALKILRFSAVSDNDAINRFQREAETVATLHHTNIVPIFFVGRDKNVNYYAMQFIDGRDLAQLIADKDYPISPEQVVALGLQAAEALAHAHRRGVVHRDVKPSNLILDQEDRLWLTDFGLARRTDDVTLSLSGMLLGTPRYMSPEHAQASSKRIDHRSDLFSLGATLYELLTRKPAFPGDVAHDVIQHILIDEPTPIRQLNPSVPRDLETVVMKCMAKDPIARYESAEKLAADLRAVLEDRPIQARRANAVEQAARWLKQNRRSVSQVSTAAMVTLAVTLTLLLGWSSYQSWNMSSLKLLALEPPLFAEILDDTGKSMRTETLPMQNAANLPAGDYKVRISADGSFSQDFDVNLARGSRDTKYTANVSDQWLITPQPLHHAYDIVDLGSERAVVVWSKDGITVHKHQGPQVAWTLKLSPETAPPISAWPGYANPRTFSSMQERGFDEANESRPWMIHDFIDVNADGIGDLVCAARHQAWLMAISGNGEGVLWFAGRSEELAMKPDVRTPMAVLSAPLLYEDLDSDGVRDFLVTIADPGPHPNYLANNMLDCQVWVEAISSRTGTTLWKQNLAKELFLLPNNQPAPYDLRWFGSVNGGYSSQGGSTSSQSGTHHRSPMRYERSGGHVYMPTTPTLIASTDAAKLGEAETSVAIVAGDKLLLLDPRTGALRESPIELGFRPGCDVQWADIDGDRTPDMVALEETTVSKNNTPTKTVTNVPKLTVWSLASRQTLWSKTLDTYWPRRPNLGVVPPKWPLVCDLNDDGVSEIVVPDESSQAENFYYYGLHPPAPTGNIALFGKSNTAKWSQKIVNVDGTVNHFIDGPDLDGDSTREVFAVTCDARSNTLRVDAISGATGSTLWGGSQAFTSNSNFDWIHVVSLEWWHSGKDGWPQLLVTISDGRIGSSSSASYTVVGFSAGTGLVTISGKEIADAQPCDLDKDGVQDLIACSSKVTQPGSQGSFHCIRGMVRQSWKRMSSLGTPVVDLNRDGVRDFLEAWGDGTFIATSGATGRELWRSRPIRTSSQLGFAFSDASCSGDINGDGIEDMIVYETNLSGRKKTPLHVVSGQSGKLIWSLQDLTIQSIQSTLAAKFIDIDNDNAPEVVWIAAMDYGYQSRPWVMSTDDAQLWMCVASGRTGELKWAQPLSPSYGSTPGSVQPAVWFRTATLELDAADLNSDGVRDFVVPGIRVDGTFETRALSGRDGSLLWQRRRHEYGQSNQALENYTSASFCDFEGDGRPEVILVEPMDPNATSVEVGVWALDSNGRELWAKSTGSNYSHFRALSKRGGQSLRPQAVQASSGQASSGQASLPKATSAHRTAFIALQLPSDRLATFDAAGNRLDRKVEYTSSKAIGLFVHDIDHDGQGELLFIEGDTLLAVRANDLNQVIWKKKLTSTFQNEILALLPASQAFPPLLVVQTDATQNKLLGINAETGKEVWCCAGPIGRLADLTSFTPPKEVALLGGKPEELPLVCFQFDSISDCRQAFLSKPVEATGDGELAFRAAVGSKVPAASGGLKDDPRWKRPLPWSIDCALNTNQLSYFAGGIFFALTLIVVPAGYVGVMLVRRRHQLSYLLLLPVVAALFLQAVTITGPDDYTLGTFLGRLGTAVFFAPAVVGLILLVTWAASRKWRRVMAWLAVLCVTSVAIAIFSLTISVGAAPLAAEESFDWQGWYLICIPVAYFLSWLLLLVTLCELIVRGFMQSVRSRKLNRTQPTPGRLSLDASGVATIVHPAQEPTHHEPAR
ncbi:MAG: protein kinase [Pirellulaceae bacterium]|nr:protein kinase [Pirellulaceae bacterium]